ncbi:hypothetical protein K3495_g16684 [Podosphaera aphanis]|nr:hypothetical protein K3495_g16684 [Podosphaera aphanis]
MRMLGRDAVAKIPRGQLGTERLDESADFFIEGHILHGQRRASGRRGAAIRDALDFDKAGQTPFDQVGVAGDLIFDIEALDEGQAEDGALLEATLTEDIQTAREALPEVPMERAINLAETLPITRVDGDVELGDRAQGG